MIAHTDAPAGLACPRRSAGPAAPRPTAPPPAANALVARVATVAPTHDRLGAQLPRSLRPSWGGLPGALITALLSAHLWGLAGPALATSPVGDSLDRPALATRLGPGSVLLGLAQAGPTTVAVGERGLVLLSADQARTWHQAQVPVSVTLTAVRFADDRHGIAVGHAGVVLSTDDGGQHWQQRLHGRQIAQALLDEARVGGQATSIAQAERLVQEGADKPLLDLAVLSSQRLLAVGAYGLAVASEDGGQHWAPWTSRLDNPKGLHLNAVRHHGAAILIAGEQGLLLYSGDGGAHFQRLASPYSGSFFTAEMLSPVEFLVAGLRGQIWHTRDAGQHWQAIANPLPASITGSVRGADGTLWWVNQAGQVLQLQEGVLRPLNKQALAPLSALLPLAGGQWLTAGLQGVQSITADGVTMASAVTPAPTVNGAGARP